MKINTSKIKTYVGFAVKSRKIRYGVDDILKLKNADLIIVSDSLAESGMKKLEAFADRKSVGLIKLSEQDFFEVVQNISIKALAVLDENLADAIKKNLTNI
jgi:ribosomal protein L7Ae-like RNA K-turn-binding protein